MILICLLLSCVLRTWGLLGILFIVFIVSVFFPLFIFLFTGTSSIDRFCTILFVLAFGWFFCCLVDCLAVCLVFRSFVWFFCLFWMIPLLRGWPFRCLVDSSVVWLISQLSGWSFCYLVDCLVVCQVPLPVVWFLCCVVDFCFLFNGFFCCCFCWLLGCLLGSSVVCLDMLLFGWLLGCLLGSSVVCLVILLFGWLLGCLFGFDRLFGSACFRWFLCCVVDFSVV